MASSNVIVDYIAGLSPLVHLAFGPKSTGANATVHFKGGATCQIDPKRQNAAHVARMIDMFRHASKAAYIQTEPGTGVVTRVLQPKSVKVVSVADVPVGDRLMVELAVSHARHFVRTSNPDYAALVGELRAAQKQGTTVFVTDESKEPEIIDVRTAFSPFAGKEAGGRAASAPPTAAVAMTAATVTQAQAQAMYDLVNAQSCPTNMSVPTCIPFLFPDDGCWARANEMCRLMTAAGITAGKFWIYGSLSVNTVNSPACNVQWIYHVAPFLLVDSGSGTIQTVIDPSLFPGPVSVSDWISIMQTSVPPSDLEQTDDTVYTRDQAGNVSYDPDYSQTNADLNTYRIDFANRCTTENPPGPPYSCP
jgi:hypothetical protein